MNARRMKRTVIRPMIVLAIIAAGGFSRAAAASEPGGTTEVVRKEPLVLMPIANAGVLLLCGDRKVLIDALFDKPSPEYRAPEPEVLDRIMSGAEPYDGVDLVLVTHNHPDHFDAALAARYLAKFPAATLLLPTDAAEEMRKADSWPAIGPRVASFDLKPGEKRTQAAAGLAVTAMRTLHSGDRESPMNIMYCFELGGWRVFHEGDSTGKPEAYRGFGLGGEPIDLALVHFWFPLQPETARFLQEVLKPSHIGLIHLPIRLEADSPGKIAQVRHLYNEIFLLGPGLPAKVFPTQDLVRRNR